MPKVALSGIDLLRAVWQLLSHALKRTRSPEFKCASILWVSLIPTPCCSSDLRSFHGEVVSCGSEQAFSPSRRGESSLTWANNLLTINVLDVTGGVMAPDSGGYMTLGNTIYVWYSLDHFESKGPPLACLSPVRLRYEIEGLEQKQYRVKLIKRDYLIVDIVALCLGGVLLFGSAMLAARMRRQARVSAAVRWVGLFVGIALAGIGVFGVAALLG